MVNKKKTGSGENEFSFQILNYAAQLLAFESNLDRMIHIALKNLADFSSADRVEIFSLMDSEKIAERLGLITDSKLDQSYKKLALNGSGVEEYIVMNRIGFHKTGKQGRAICLPLTGSENRPIGYINLEFEDDSDLSEAQMQNIALMKSLIAVSMERIWYFKMAMYDGLTGLYVRRQFDNRIEEEIARLDRFGGHLSLLLLDIDNFKNVNDTYGHQVGDTVLQVFSDILKNSIRKHVDFACRYGGEELIVIMTNTDAAGARVVAERFRTGCEEHSFEDEGKSFTVTVSGGIASITKETGLTAKKLINRADTALYEAKKAGRNRNLDWHD